MAFYKDVNENEPFQPSASLANDVRHLLNSFGAVGSPKVGFGISPQTMTVQCYNASTGTIPAGRAVSLSSQDGETVLGVPFVDGTAKYGVTTEDVASNGGFRAVTAGLVSCSVNGTAGTSTHIKPTAGGKFEFADDGIPLIWDSGTGTALAFLQADAGGDGGVTIGTSLDKSFDVAGGALEADFMANTTADRMATAFFGAGTRTQGDTSRHRPSVSQREMTVKTPASNGIFISPYFSADTSTAVALESEPPPQDFGTNTAWLAWVDGAKYASNSVSVQRFAKFEGGVLGVPYAKFASNSVSVSFADVNETSGKGVLVFDADAPSVGGFKINTCSFLGVNGAGNFQSPTLPYGANGTLLPKIDIGGANPQWDFFGGGNTNSHEIVYYDKNEILQSTDLGFEADYSDHIVIMRRQSGELKSRYWVHEQGKSALVYIGSNGELSFLEAGDEDADQLIVCRSGGTLKAVTAPTSGRYKLQAYNGYIRWVNDN